MDYYYHHHHHHHYYYYYYHHYYYFFNIYYDHLFSLLLLLLLLLLVLGLSSLQVRRCPETGHEELVVLAGYCNNVLADMNPHRLDLTTWSWVRESGLVPNPGHGDALALPSPRQRAAAETVGDKWLLVLGGSPTQVWDVMPLFCIATDQLG